MYYEFPLSLRQLGGKKISAGFSLPRAACRASNQAERGDWQAS
jgi:hypothetical protein